MPRARSSSDADASTCETIFYLDIDPEDPVASDKWYEDAYEGDLRCSWDCAGIHPRNYGIPVHVPLDREPRRAIAPAPFALIVRRDLFEVLRPHLTDYVLGTCFIEKTGRVLDNWVTVYTPMLHSVMLRGGINAKYFVCPTCGYYWPESDGSSSQVEYIVRSHLRDRNAVQSIECRSFMVTPWLASRIDWSPFKHLEFYPYPVLDRPIDGRHFPGDPE